MFLHSFSVAIPDTLRFSDIPDQFPPAQWANRNLSGKLPVQTGCLFFAIRRCKFVGKISQFHPS